MSSRAPAGWYADPGVPGQLRWWDGDDWAENTVAPAAGPDVQAPAPTPAQAPTPAPAPAPAQRQETPRRPRREPSTGSERGRIRPGTVWIWLAIVASTLPWFTGVLVDSVTVGRVIGYLTFGPDYDPGVGGRAIGGLVVLAALNAVLVAASVLCAWLDHRALRRRGIEAPFGWGWAVLAFVATLGVYVVGRTVVVHRRTGRGLAPLWAWAIGTLVGLIVGAAWLVWFFDGLWTAVTTAH